MTKQARTRAAAAIIGAAPASFVVQMWLFFSYFESRPKEPHPELDLVHALNNHGSYVFISDAEATGLALLMYVFIIAFGLTILIVPKEFKLPPPGTPRWVTKVNASFKTGLEKPSTELTLIFLGSMTFTAAAIWFSGPAIVHFFVTHGLVLHL
jgi:hypothetical protein